MPYDPRNLTKRTNTNGTPICMYMICGSSQHLFYLKKWLAIFSKRKETWSMGQVPKKAYGIVGSGKAAKHIKYYFQCLNILIKSWARTENIKAPSEVLADCDTILLLINDSEIESFIAQNPFLKEKEVVHFSGSLVVPGIQSTHPLWRLKQPGTTRLPEKWTTSFSFKKGFCAMNDSFSESLISNKIVSQSARTSEGALIFSVRAHDLIRILRHWK